jgi:riboflavin biosynthesis pyrimidine reductase
VTHPDAASGASTTGGGTTDAPATVRRLVPDRHPVSLTDAYAYPPPDQRPPGRPWVRANMITTVDGAVTGADGVSGSIGTPADLRVFRVLRSLADVILVGAGTARVEGYGPARVPIAVVTARLEVDLTSPLLAEAVHPTVLITTASTDPDRLAAARAVTDVVVCGRDAVDLPAALAELGRRGHRDVLCEGGPSLLGSLVAADCLDELCMTTAPMLVGSSDGPTGRAVTGPALPAPVRLRLGHLLEDEGTLLARWLVEREQPARPTRPA